MKTRLSVAAAQDIEEIIRAISAESRMAARGFRDRFVEIRRFLGEFPSVGRKTDDKAVRYVNTGNYPYLVFFEIVEGEVLILRITHGARNPESFPGRPS